MNSLEKFVFPADILPKWMFSEGGQMVRRMTVRPVNKRANDQHWSGEDGSLPQNPKHHDLVPDKYFLPFHCRR